MMNKQDQVQQSIEMINGLYKQNLQHQQSQMSDSQIAESVNKKNLIDDISYSVFDSNNPIVGIFCLQSSMINVFDENKDKFQRQQKIQASQLSKQKKSISQPQENNHLKDNKIKNNKIKIKNKNSQTRVLTQQKKQQALNKPQQSHTNPQAPPIPQKQIDSKADIDILQKITLDQTKKDMKLHDAPSLKLQDSLRKAICPQQLEQKNRNFGKAVIFSKTAIIGQVKIGYNENKKQYYQPATILKKQTYTDKDSYYYVCHFDLYTKAKTKQIHFQFTYEVSSGWFGGKQSLRLLTTSQINAYRCFAIISIQKLDKIQILNSCCLAYQAFDDIVVSAAKIKQKSEQQIFVDKLDNIYLIQTQLQGLKFKKTELQSMVTLKKIQSFDKLRFLIYMLSFSIESPQYIIDRLQNKASYDHLIEGIYKRPKTISGYYDALQNTYLKAIYEYLLQENQQVKNADRESLIYRYLNENLKYQPNNTKKQLIVKTFQKASFILNKQIEFCQTSQLVTPKQLFIIFVANFKSQNNKSVLEYQIKIKQMLEKILQKYKKWNDASICQNSAFKQFQGWMKNMNSHYQQTSKLIKQQLKHSLTFYQDTQVTLRSFYIVNRQFYNNWRAKTNQGFDLLIKLITIYNPIAIFQEYLLALDRQLVKKYEDCLQLNLAKITHNLLDQLLQNILNNDTNYQKNSKLRFIDKLITKKIINDNCKQISAYDMARILAKYFANRQKLQLYKILMRFFRSSPWIKLKIQKTGLLKLEDNSLKLGELCLQFDQNQQIGEKLCQKFGIALRVNLTNANDRITFHHRLINHLKKEINSNYKRIYNDALQGKLENLQQAKQDIFGLLISDPYNQLKEYLQYYFDYQKQIFSKIQEQIMLKNLTYDQLTKLNTNQAILKSTCPIVHTAVKKSLKKINTLFKKLEKAIQVLNTEILGKKNKSELQQSIKQLEDYKYGIQNNIISSLQLNEKYKPLLQFYEEIAQYQKEKQWKQLQIPDLSTLYKQRQRFKTNYINKIDNTMNQLCHHLQKFPAVIFDSLIKEKLSKQKQKCQTQEIKTLTSYQDSQKIQGRILNMKKIQKLLEKKIQYQLKLTKRTEQIYQESIQYISKKK